MLPTIRHSLQLASSTAARHHRSLWTTSTFLSCSPTSLVAHLQATPPASSPVLLYALSKNIPTDLLSLIQSALSDNTPTSIGCLSEVLPASALGNNLPSPHEAAPRSELYSIAIASFNPSRASAAARAIPFRSSLRGRANVSLGREIKALDAASEQSEERAFEAFLSGKSWRFGDDSVNANVGVIEELQGISAEHVKEILCFTADRSQTLLGAFSKFPATGIAGIVGSSTPFHSATQAPYSLFFNKEVLSTGAVGVAVVDPASSARTTQIEYSGMVHMGDPMEVTSSKGNIVLTLDKQNAARLLLNAVQSLPSITSSSNESLQSARTEEKERDFFAAVFDSGPKFSNGEVDLHHARHISRIMAGDPSRGAMSVETEEDIPQGSFISFLHRSPSSSVSIAPLSLTSLSFLSTNASYSSLKPLDQTLKAGDVITLPGFVAASENGVVWGAEGRKSRVCAIEGTIVSVE